jgi:HEAT repeat protein
MSYRFFLVPLTVAFLAFSFAAAGRGGEQEVVQLKNGRRTRPVEPRGNPDGQDRSQLIAARLPIDNAGLVHFLDLRARGEPARGSVDELIEALAGPTPEARFQACADLVAIGTPALPRLRALVREGAKPADVARRCLASIESDGGTLTSATVRLLTHRRAADAASVLLAYLPHAENDHVLQGIVEALRTLAHDETDKVVPAVVRAMGDDHPLRRATAILVLNDSDVWQHREALQKLLLDPAPSARLRAAMVLAKVDDPQAVETLITLLPEVGDRESRVAIDDLLGDLAGALAPKVKFGEDEPALLQARDAWRKWWSETEGVGFLDELKKRTLEEVDPVKAQELIRKLGDNTFEVRAKAEKDLVRVGVPILPLLRQVFRDPPDLEARARIRACIETIEGANEKAKEEYYPRFVALARLVALRKPPGAAEAILAYLPSQDEDSLREELQNALAAVAFSKGEANPVVLKALTDSSATRRIAAARALCTGPQPDHLEKARRLLQDADPAVRLEVALALAEARDPDALPALASLIAQAPADLAAQAEAFLSQLAGEAGPKDLPQGEVNREKRSVAWGSWAQTAKSNPAVFGTASTSERERVGPVTGASLRGYTLLVQPQANTITALGSDGKERWALTGLEGPTDALVLANQHILVAEANRVTERDLRGTVLWKLEGVAPVSVQRLPNGNTFIPCNDVLIEVNRSGKEVLRAMVGGIAAARRLRDGRIVAFDRNEIIHLDKAGKEVKRVAVMCGGAGCNEVLDNGHVLALSPGMGNMIEFDQDGTEIGRFEEQGAAHACRLPNGHTLVLVMGSKYIELDKDWKQIKETPLTGDVFRVKGW